MKLVNLGTHTTGGMPLQAPDNVHSTHEVLQYLKSWKPAKPAGTVRTYSNVSIGALGWITARAMHGDFATLVTEHVFKPLDMQHTYLRVPKDQQANYAWGYGKDGKPIRVSPGVFDQEAYGVNDGERPAAVRARQPRTASAGRPAAPSDQRDPHRLFLRQADHAGPDLGAVPVSGQRRCAA